MEDENRHFDTHIVAAIEARLPPKMLILNDPSHTSYDIWDLKLIKAHTFLSRMMDGNYPIYWTESKRVDWTVERKISRPDAAMDRAQQAEAKKIENGGKGAKPEPGLRFLLKPRVLDGGPMPTLDEYLKSKKPAESSTQELPEGAGTVVRGKFGGDVFVPGNSENLTRSDDEGVE